VRVTDRLGPISMELPMMSGSEPPTAWRPHGSQQRQTLRSRLAQDRICIVPGVTDALTARLAERAGFEAVFATGAGIANTLLGIPDIGLTTMSEVVEANRRLTSAISLPLIADADTGFGNHIGVVRTVRELESAGVAAIVMEDQVSPKRCGHFDGKRVVPVAEMIQLLIAATTARTDNELILIARTDAIATEGLESALSRAREYVAAGADVIFVEAPRTVEQLAAIPQAVPAPCLVNMVEGGLSPTLPADELQSMGYRLVVYANLALRIAAQAVSRAFKVLLQTGASDQLMADILPWQDRQKLVGLPEWEGLDDQIVQAALTFSEGISSSDKELGTQ
jgi:2-methylisocitrate lyase-like PEP mutase family enzyme